MSEQLVIPAGTVLSADLDRLRPSCYRADSGTAYRQFLHQLVPSVRRFGVLVPLLVHAPKPGELEVIDGDRRACAARMARLERVPVILLPKQTPESARLLALIVNMHRAPLPIASRAQSMLAMFDDGLGADVIGERLGWAPATVIALAQGMRLLEEVHAHAEDPAPTYHPPGERAADIRPSPVPAPRIAPTAIHNVLTRHGDRMAPEVRAELEALLRGWTPPPTRQRAA